MASRGLTNLMSDVVLLFSYLFMCLFVGSIGKKFVIGQTGSSLLRVGRVSEIQVQGPPSCTRPSISGSRNKRTWIKSFETPFKGSKTVF
jgi:hypothetical protein